MPKVTVAEAAEVAKVSKSTIWIWLRQLKLTRYTMGARTLIELDEIEAIKDGTKRGIPMQLAPIIVHRLEKLERQIEFLNYASGSYLASDISPDQAMMFYQLTKSWLGKSDLAGWYPKNDDIDEYIALMKNLSEEVLEMIQMQLPEEAHPWRPFMQLAARIQNRLKNRKDYGTTLDDQLRFRQLGASRARLRDIAIVFILADLDSDAHQTLITEAGPATVLEGEVLRRLMWRGHQVRTATLYDVLPETIPELLKEATALVNKGQKRTKRERVHLVRRLHRMIELIRIEQPMRNLQTSRDKKGDSQ